MQPPDAEEPGVKILAGIERQNGRTTPPSSYTHAIGRSIYTSPECGFDLPRSLLDTLEYPIGHKMTSEREFDRRTSGTVRQGVLYHFDS